MCLIAYVPEGKALSREVFDNANVVNPHGIGVMSERGVLKFFGNKQLKRARNYVEGLAKEKIPHAVHWRYATHGSKQLALCHPFKLPNVEAHIMHNGVLGGMSADVNADCSDTLAYVNKKLADAPATHDSLDYWNKVCKDFGRSNKGLVMYPDGHFIILNQDEGVTIDGIWYSNSYSLPSKLQPSGYNFTPARLRPPTSYNGHSGTTYPYGSRGGPDYSNFGGPYGHSIYWSEFHKSYGYWEGSNFQKFKVTRDVLVIGSSRDERPAHISGTSGTTATTSTVTPVELRPDAHTDEYADKKCPVCMRFKKDPPHGHLICWCTQERIAEYWANKRRTENSPATPVSLPLLSGPTALSAAPKSSSAVQCDHGNDNWENCPKCIEELEGDAQSQVQRWLANRNGHNWRLRSPDNGGYPIATDPQQRADDLADNVIQLPRMQSEK